jgi:hypothetical protein
MGNNLNQDIIEEIMVVRLLTSKLEVQLVCGWEDSWERNGTKPPPEFWGLLGACQRFGLLIERMERLARAVRSRSRTARIVRRKKDDPR